MVQLADAAPHALDWISSVAVEADGGLAWCEGGQPFDDLYAGTAGVLLGCAEVAAAGLNPARIAAGARARLLHLAEQGPGVATMPDDGLFSGWAGVVVALRSWARVAGDADAADGAARVRVGIAERILESSPDPSRYIDIICGDAGILLALLADDSAVDSAVAANSGVTPSSGVATGSDVVRRAAHVLADRLVELAGPGPDGPHWRMVAGWEYLMPGFSHGTAGVAYALGAAGRVLNRDDLVDVAIRAADALLAVGDHPDGWAVPLTIPPHPRGPAVNYGWCHGPTGTVRLFLLLHALDPRPRWQHAIDACLQALRDSRLPARLYPGYWDNLARCCGTAGVGQLLLDRYQATRDPALLDWADTLAADVLDRAVTTPHGVTWSNTEHTRNPPDVPPEPGFMQGTAGIAGWLARLHTLHGHPDTPPAPTGLDPAWL